MTQLFARQGVLSSLTRLFVCRAISKWSVLLGVSSSRPDAFAICFGDSAVALVDTADEHVEFALAPAFRRYIRSFAR